MEAGRTGTCLLINYDSTERLVEPYSLKYMQRKDGVEREYLYVFDRVGGRPGPGPKSMVAEKMTSIKNTTEKFAPRWPVELFKSGESADNHYFLTPTDQPNRHPGFLRQAASSTCIAALTVEKRLSEVAWTPI